MSETVELRLSEVADQLQLVPDMIYHWEGHFPELIPRKIIDGQRFYSAWEIELLRCTQRYYFTCNQDVQRTRAAIEHWLRHNPRPVQESKLEEVLGEEEPGGRASLSGELEGGKWHQVLEQLQGEILQLKGELNRARETIQQQHAALKQRQLQLNHLKESIRKGIYDLQDLLVDKQETGR